MTMWFILTIVALLLATYFSALAMSLMNASRSALADRFESRDRNDAATWLFAHLDTATLSISLLRTTCRIAFVMLVLVDMQGVGEGAQLTWGAIGLACLIGIPILWVSSTVIASAIARYAATGLIVGSFTVLRPVTAILHPIVRGLSFLDEIVRRLCGAEQTESAAEAELLRSIEDTHREGVLDEGAAALMENIVAFSATDVGEVMTPRTDIEGIEFTEDINVIRSFIAHAGHSRIPVFEDNLDNIIGILYVKDLIPFLGTDVSKLDLRPLLRAPYVVPETKPVSELLGDFQRNEVHLAMVIDEYGGTAGLVTIEDVLEEIVGEIHDEHEPDSDDQPSLERIDNHRVEVDGRFHIDDLNEQLDLELPEDDEYDTVAGFVMAQLGRVPEVGETLEFRNARFTTLAATPTHIQRMAVELLDEPAAVNANGNGNVNGK